MSDNTLKQRAITTRCRIAPLHHRLQKPEPQPASEAVAFTKIQELIL
jgi:hypothetical protein